MNTSTEAKGNRNLFFFLSIGAGLLLCCVIGLALFFSGILSKIPVKTALSPTKDVKPSHYGVFILQNGELIELQEQEIFDIPVEKQMGNAQTISRSQPTIVIWRSNTNLDYLEFLKLNQYIGQSKVTVRYNATPKENGIIELTPVSPLSTGIYCLIQGDPLAVTLPGWCFGVGESTNSQSPTAFVGSQNVTTKKKFDKECYSYEQSSEFDKAIECYKDRSLSEPNNFYPWESLSRLYEVSGDYQSALDASLQALSVAENSDERIQAYVRIGFNYYNLGDFDAAIKYLEEGKSIDVASLSPDWIWERANILVWLSQSYEANGQQVIACKSWKETLEFGKSIDYQWAIDWANSRLSKCQ